MRDSKTKNYYSWVICGVCTLLIFVTMGTASNGLSVFMPYIRESYGLTNAQTSSLVTLRCTFAFLSMLVVGKYYEKTGYRLGTGIAAMLCAVAYFLYSRAGGYMGFCIGASIGGIGYGLGSMIPVAILMNRWFVKHRALAVGICSAGSGMAIIVLPTVLTSLILKYSLQTAFLFVVGYVIVFSILIFLLIRDKPSDLGLEPLGKSDVINEYRGREGDERKRTAEDAMRREAQKAKPLTRSDWALIGIVSVFMGAMANPGFMHLTMLYTTEGFRPMTVALIVSVVGIVLTGAKILFGETADLLGGYRASMLFLAISVLGHALCCMAFTGSVPIAMAAAVVIGLGYSITTVGIPVWAGDLVAQIDYAETVRKMQLIYAAGAMVFASVPGIMADHLGGYIPTYTLFGSLTIVTAICLTAVYKRRMPKVR